MGRIVMPSCHLLVVRRPAANSLARRKTLVQSLSFLLLCGPCGLIPAARAQRSPGVDDHFRQASEAMRSGNLEAAAEGFAAVAKQAADALDKAAKLAPGNTDILYHRGHAHLLVSRNSYERMFKGDPKSWRVHQVLGQVASEGEHYTDAIYEYLEAIKLAPTQPGLHEELGSVYRNANKMDEAEEAFQRELEIDPHNVLARYKLGVLLMEKGDGAKAKELIVAALQEKPGR